MESLPRTDTVRLLCPDGGGIKGYTSLLILKRILRTIKVQAGMTKEPRACDVFDLITGTSTGGLIAVMLGKMGMTTDDAIRCYEVMGGQVFGNEPSGGKFGRLMRGVVGSPFYKIQNLQQAVRTTLSDNDMDEESDLLEEPQPVYCKIMLCVTRQSISKADVLRNYIATHPTQENYTCKVWEAASATAAAPMYFDHVKFKQGGETWCDGGIRRNNPINEALAEAAREPQWKDKDIGCVVSIGTGVPNLKEMAKDLPGFLKVSVSIMTDAEETAEVFAQSSQGSELARSNRYFRFSVPQGVSDLHLDDWKSTEKMKSLTTEYLRKYGSGKEVERCATSLLDPDKNLQADVHALPSILPHKTCVSFITRSTYFTDLQKFFRSKDATHHAFLLWGLGGTGKTQIALHFAHWVKNRFSVFWVRADSFNNFAHDFSAIQSRLTETGPDAGVTRDQMEVMHKVRGQLESQDLRWIIVLDNADDFDDFIGAESTSSSIASFLPSTGRFLITSRDPRFLGGFVPAENGRRVLPMDAGEAQQLLLKSIPQHLLPSKTNDSSYARELLTELGYLPLAIAQAAANISDQQLTLLEYVKAYRNRSERLQLLEKSTRDHHSADPRNMLQSVKVTWDLSMEYLEKKHPLSALCLNYLGFWHWQDIPTELLRRLPEFSDMAPLRFRGVLRKLLHLSLVEMTGEESGEWPQISLHPLVHSRISERISPELAERCLVNNMTLLARLFPIYSNGYTSTQLELCTLLQSHSTIQVQFCEDFGVKASCVTTLVLGLATYFRLMGLTRESVRLSRKALQARDELPGPLSLEKLEARAGLIRSLSADAEYVMAVQECDEFLAILPTADIDKACARSLELDIYSHAMSAYHSTGRYAETVEFARLVLTHAEEFPSETTRAATLTARHDLSHYMRSAGDVDGAIQLNQQVLSEMAAVIAENPSEIELQAHMSAMTLRGHLLIKKENEKKKEAREQEPSVPEKVPGPAEEDEILDIYVEVYRQYLQDGSIWSIDLWKACNNVLRRMFTLQFNCYQRYFIVQPLLAAAIKNPIHLQGRILETFKQTYHAAGVILREFTFEDEDGVETLYEYLDSLLSPWEHLIQDSVLKVTDIDNRNTYAVFLQQTGRFDESEKVLRGLSTLIKDAQEEPTDSSMYDVVYYNLMLAVARQGRVDEAKMVRSAHLSEVQRAEAMHGDLERRMVGDGEERAVYEEAQRRLDSGKISREGMKTDEWFVRHRKTLKKTQLIYGKLQLPTLDVNGEEEAAAIKAPLVVTLPDRGKAVTSGPIVGDETKSSLKTRIGGRSLPGHVRSESRFRKLIKGKKSRDATPDRAG